MKLKQMRALVLAGTLCLTLLGGCASSGQNTTQIHESSDSTADIDPESAEIPKTYKPSELVILSQDKYENPDMGLDFTIPQALREQMDQQTVAMVDISEVSDNDDSFSYIIFTWNSMTEEQKNAEVASKGNGFYEWLDGLERIGTLGVYHPDQIQNLDELTKCTEHKEIGKSSDGDYTYYLSINPDADKTLTDMISEIKTEITDMVPLDEMDWHADAAGENMGEFSIQDIHDKTYTAEMFQEYDLTMINVFTTWCTPCINEIPDIEKLYQDMAGQGINIVGIVLDARDDSGDLNNEALQKAQLLEERTKASYPFLIPDEGYLNGRLQGIEAVPETFFVDKNGNIVGDTYSGSHSFEDWKTIVETELNNLKGEVQ